MSAPAPHPRPATPAPATAAPPALGGALDALLAELSATPDRPRAWSLVVTIFGDAAAPRGGALRVAALQQIAGRLGVGPAALRTALSRLARDGWLERERRGRASFHALTPARRAEVEAASRRIYAPGPPAWQGAWLLAAPDPGVPTRQADAALRAAGFAAPAPEGPHLRPARPGETAEAAAAALPPGSSVLLAPAGAHAVAPALVAAAWPAAPAAARLAALLGRLAPLAAAAGPGRAPEPLDALATRVLLIHLWRRAVLPAPDLPAALHPPGWPGERARAAVRALWWRLAPAAEAWLDACAGGPAGALPPAGPAFARRFGGPPAPDRIRESERPPA